MFLDKSLNAFFSKKSHLLNHYQWLGWPDDGVPDDHILPSKLIDLARDCVKPITSNQAPDPIVVHCSAGVGRTGTLVAIDMARSKLISGGNINTPKVIYICLYSLINVYFLTIYFSAR